MVGKSCRSAQTKGLLRYWAVGVLNSRIANAFRFIFTSSQGTKQTKAMLNLDFAYRDAVTALKDHAARLGIPALAPTVFLMQRDVINSYRYALDHYLPLPLDTDYLQDSSLGTPYQKWAFFTNGDFLLLSFAVANLLRYTSRLVHETTCVALCESRNSEQGFARGILSNKYTNKILELRDGKKRIGLVMSQDDEKAMVFFFRVKWPDYGYMISSKSPGQQEYFRITKDWLGQEKITPVDYAEFKQDNERNFASIAETQHDIHDRARVAELRQQGHAELALLEKIHAEYSALCDTYCRKHQMVAPFTNLNESFWT